MRTMALVLVSAGLATGQLNKIIIQTKPAPPMSRSMADGTVGGYSIQFWKDFVAPKLGITDVQTNMLKDNNEIMSSSGLDSTACGASSCKAAASRSKRARSRCALT